MRAVATKLIYLLVVLFLVSLGTFFMLELIPGDPALAVVGPDATAEQVAAIRAELGFDEPAVQRYVEWLGGVVQGDLGRSLVAPTDDVASLIWPRLQVTIEIALLALVASLLIAVPCALLAANRPGSTIDRVMSGAAFGLISVPSFLSGLLLILLFVFTSDAVKVILVLIGVAACAGLVRAGITAASHLPAGSARRQQLLRRIPLAIVPLAITALLAWRLPSFPRQGFVRLTDGEGLAANLKGAFLPFLTLALIEGAVLMRVLRADLVATLGEDFILAAKAKGMPRWRILLFDALRPSSFSLLTIAGVAFGRLLGGTVIVETVFNLPGIGSMLVRAIRSNNYTVVQAIVLVLSAAYVVLNSVVDVVYNVLDPRIRRGHR